MDHATDLPRDGHTDISRERDAELRRARVVQREMLPSLPELPGLDISTLYEPCSEIGGDFFDIFVVGPHHVGMVIGDVSGHGIDAALVMAMAKKTIQLHARGRLSPGETLCAANADLYRELPRQTFVTVGYGILDLRDGGFRFVRAGHTPLVHLCDADEPPRVYEPQGMPVGMLPVEKFEKRLEETHLELTPGDTLIWATDGIHEAVDPNGEAFGWDRLVATLGTAFQRHTEIAVRDVKTALDGFISSRPAHDDCTLLAVRFTSPVARPLPRPTAARRAVRTNMRPGGLPVFGREREMESLAGLILDPDCGVITLRGPGGIGKTTLARACAMKLLDRFPGGVWFVDLAEAGSASDLAMAVAGALGVPVTGPDPERTVANMLEYRKPLLLILDNFEQIADCGPGVLKDWRASAPRAKMLVTSRFALQLREERVVVLDPLPTPPKTHEHMKAGDLAGFDSARLFLDRARRVDPEFALTDDNAPAVAAICEGLDGLPLAIELAAARVLVLSPEQIRARLEKKFALLATSDQDQPERHRTLKASIDFSYEILSDEEKKAFLKLSVFRSGATLEAIEDVLDLDGFDAPDPLDLTQSLCAKSLLLSVDQAGTKRFSMFPVLREYAEHRLARGDEGLSLPELHRRHALHYAGFSEEISKRIRSPEHAAAIARMERELDNLWAACDRMIEVSDGALAARLILGVHRLLSHRPRSADHHEDRLEKILALLSPDRDRQMRIQILSAIANRLTTANRDRADALTCEALDLVNERTAASVRSELWAVRAWVLRFRGREKEALQAMGRADAEAKSASLPLQQAMIQGRSAIMRHEAGASASEIMPEIEAAAAVCQQHGDLTSAARTLNSLGVAQVVSQDLRGAIATYRRALSLLEEAGTHACLEYLNLAITCSLSGDAGAALEHFESAETAAREGGNKYALMRTLLARAIHLARDPAGREQYETDLEEAEALARKMGSAVDMGLCLEYRAKDAWLQGRIEDAASLIEAAEAADHVTAAHDVFRSLERCVITALFDASAGRIDPAKQAVENAREKIAANDKAPPDLRELLEFACARLALAQGDAPSVEKFVDAARRIHEQTGPAHPTAYEIASSLRSLTDRILEKARRDIAKP